jgi:hypothetical protein
MSRPIARKVNTVAMDKGNENFLTKGPPGFGYDTHGLQRPPQKEFV